LTKSGLVLRDLDVLAGGKARVGVTITTPDERLRELWEPQAATLSERWQVVAAARRAGLETAVMFGPLLPLLSDDEATVAALLSRAAAAGVDVIWVDGLNPRPRVWPAVAELLRQHFPQLTAHYRRVLFDEQARAAYLDGLRARVARAAAELGIADRVKCCM
jgi:DNA repair photolyase